MTHLLNNFIVFSRQNKNEERLGHSFLHLCWVKKNTWVNFNATLDYRSLCRSIYFWCHDTTLENIFSIEKLNFTWNKHVNFKDFKIIRPFICLSYLRGRWNFKVPPRPGKIENCPPPPPSSFWWRGFHVLSRIYNLRHIQLVLIQGWNREEVSA